MALLFASSTAAEVAACSNCQSLTVMASGQGRVAGGSSVGLTLRAERCSVIDASMRMTYDSDADAAYLAIGDKVADGSAVENVVIERPGRTAWANGSWRAGAMKVTPFGQMWRARSA